MPTISLRQTQGSPLTVAQLDDNFEALNTAIVALQETPVTSGSVTSVAITVPSFLSRTGSPITSSGTIAITLATQTANQIFAGPTTGGAAQPTFRSIVLADLPTITVAKGGTNATSFAASRVILSNSGGTALEVSAVTTTELGYLSGVTSAIQTQLNAKQATITVLSIANGGTNSSTAAGARINLLPSLTGNGLKFLRSNAGETDVEWAVPSSTVASVNSLTGALTVAVGVGTTGNDVNVSNAGTTVTINVPPASATVSGKVNIISQSFKGVKTFVDGIVLPITNTYIAYSNSGLVQGSVNYVVNNTKEQMEVKRLSVSERHTALAFNSTSHTTNQTIDPESDHILYFDCTGGNLDCNLFDSTNPLAEMGSIYRIVKTTAANNLTIKCQGGDSIGVSGTTTDAFTGTKGFIEVQLRRAGLFGILERGVIS